MCLQPVHALVSRLQVIVTQQVPMPFGHKWRWILHVYSEKCPMKQVQDFGIPMVQNAFPFVSVLYSYEDV